MLYYKNAILKRSFDLIMATLCLFFVWWIILFGWILSYYDTGKGGFFVQKRVGRYGRLFNVIKLRTMRLDNSVMTTITTKSDRRITNTGRLLRKLKIDELPQLINVIFGDMSFVGPRPALMNQHDLVSLREEKDLNKLKPGLTGWAQINGRDELSIKDKVIYDEEYMQKSSIMFDVLIIIRTIIRTIRKTNISH